MKSTIFSLCSLLLLSLLMPLSAAAQAVRGTITDVLTGKGIANLEVTLGDLVTHTDSLGHYAFYFTYPPQIVSFSPAGDTTISEGDSVHFAVSATDPENDSLSYAWAINGVVQPTATDTFFTYYTDLTSAGVDTIEAMAIDPWFTVKQQWLVTVLNVNRAPSITHYSPQSDTTIYEKDAVLFEIRASDLDNEPLSFLWAVNGSLDPAASDSTFLLTTTYESAGVDTITGMATDTYDTTAHQWLLTILDKAKPRILFDETHRELKTISWERARELNPQNPAWPYWEKFKEAVQTDYSMEGLYQGEFSKSRLQNYNVIMMATPTIGLTTNELTNVENFIKSGGALLILSDIFQPPVNGLTNRFGITYDGFTLVEATNNQGLKKYLTDFDTTHAITKGISRYHFDWGNSLTVSGAAVPLAWTPAEVYQDRNGNFIQDGGELSGPFVYLAVAEYGEGRVVCMSDDAFFDIALSDWGNGKLVMNILAWMVEKQITTEVRFIESPTATLPTSFTLFQNYPNPFNAGTIIRFQLPKASKVELRIYNIFGQEIATLLDAQKVAGSYQVRWNGSDKLGHLVASGIYLIRFEAGEYAKVRKMIVVR